MKKYILFTLLFFLFCNFSIAKSIEEKIKMENFSSDYKTCIIKTKLKDKEFFTVEQEVLFNCKNNEFQILSIKGYNKKNKLIYTDNKPFFAEDIIKNNKFYKIKDGSVTQKWYKKACRIK